MISVDKIRGVICIKYIEFGIGNRWIVRTETELPDGTEYEEKGIVKPIKPYSMYIRIWVRRTVLIFDLKEGLKVTKKKQNALKVVFGITSY